MVSGEGYLTRSAADCAGNERTGFTSYDYITPRNVMTTSDDKQNWLY